MARSPAQVNIKSARIDNTLDNVLRWSLNSKSFNRAELAATASSKNAPQKSTPASSVFYEAFLSSPDMFIIADPTNGTYIEVNDSFIENTGYSREELIGHSV